jgi:tRNA(Ile)-lysidine synthase
MVLSGPSPELVGRFRKDLEALAGASPDSLGVAVSGGPDSLALLLLAQAGFPGRVQAATVDHGLRPESGEEAAFVAAVCSELGVPHAVLQPARPIEGNLQSGARDARYALLESWRSAQRLDWVLTGHHADDQAETLLMRLNRGSGTGGLAGVRAVNGAVVRPLLGWRHSELVEIVDKAGLEPVSDPSNRDEKFDRARLRRHLQSSEWLDPAAMARSAKALADAEEALEWAAERLFAERATLKDGQIALDPAGLPSELLRRLVLLALRRVEARAAPRGEELSRLVATLRQGGTGTLAGVKAISGVAWRFEPAPPRGSG